MVVVRHREHVIKKDIHTLILVRMDIVQVVRMVIQVVLLRCAVVGRVQELVINVVHRRINIRVQVLVIVEEVVRHVTVSIRLVTVQVDILGVVAVVWSVHHLVIVAINIPVVEPVIVEEVVRHVTVSIQVVHVRRIIHGTEVLVYAIVVSNMRVAVLERLVPVRYVVESISYVYVRLIMYRFVT